MSWTNQTTNKQGIKWRWYKMLDWMLQWWWNHC